MRKQLFLLIPIFGLHALFLSGCESKAVPTPILSPTSTPAPTLTDTPAYSYTPTKINTPTAPPTQPPTKIPTLRPAVFDILTTTFKQSGNWNLGLPYMDSSLPDLITPTSSGYRLNPDFQVGSIDLSYEWWGLGDPVLDYQRIEVRDSVYWRGEEAVSAALVKALIHSIAHMRPQPQMLQNITHTDDYPIWAIEMTGLDGSHVLLYSNSNGENYAPWNVIYNGQIFVQFDGQIYPALSKLFDVSKGEPMAWTYEGEPEEEYLTVDTIGWPGQLSHGFNGLLAVQRGFNYWPDPQKAELHGYVKGRSSIGGMGHMIIGSITDLQKIELEVVKGRSVPCPLKSLPSEDPAALVWEFVCPVDLTTAKGSYRYPIRVTFGTDKNQNYTVTGELFGYWEQGTVLPVTRFPKEIEKILESSPDVQDLMTDHQVAVVKFNVAADPATGLLDHEWTADVVLLGQARIDNRILPYSVTIPVGIKDKKIIQWDLDRAKLETLLQDVLNQAITRRFLDEDPNLVLNLYYAESKDYPIVFESDLDACADFPKINGLPNAEQPLRGFAFNQSWSFNGLQIMIIDHKLRFWYLDIRPSLPEDSIWAMLLPTELTSKDVPPFREILNLPFSPYISIAWDPNASAADIDTYKALIQALPGKIETYSWGVAIMKYMLGITADGRLSLISCEGP